ARFAGNVTLRKTSHSNGKLALFPNEPDQLAGEFKAAVCDLEFTSAGGIAPQGQEILHTQLADLAQQILNLLACRTNACQVRHSCQTVLTLDPVDNHQRLIARAATGSISDRTKIRPRLNKRRDRFPQQIPVTLLRLGREELKGDHRSSRDAF